MIKERNKVESFFESYAEDFDSIYGHSSERSLLGRINDRMFRSAMYARFKQTIDHINNDNIKSILDIGCGSGRYCFEFLKHGKNVTGIDLSEEMLKLAQDICVKDFPNGNIELIHGDYIDYEFNEKFDASVLMGLFDYISNPETLLSKLKNDTNKVIIGSFPKLWNIWTFQRFIRYKIRRCPIFFYTKKQLKLILTNLGINNYEIIDNGREYYLIITLNNY